MNGDLKAAINKAKQMASVNLSTSNANGAKKRKKATDLKPINTEGDPGGSAKAMA